MPIDDPASDRCPEPSGSADPDVTATDIDAHADIAAGTESDTDVHTDPATGRDAPSGAAAPLNTGPSIDTGSPVDPAGPSDATSSDDSDDGGTADPSAPIHRDPYTDEARTQNMVGRPARLTPVKTTPVKPAPLRTTPIKATPVVATPIKPFPVKASQTGAAPVWLGRGQVPQTRSPSGRGHTSDAATAPVPASESIADATALAEAPVTSDAPILPNARADVGTAASDPTVTVPARDESTANAAAPPKSPPAPSEPEPAGFAPGVASVEWHPPMADPPPAAAVSPAPLGFTAPGELFAPARHAAARPGRRRALLVTTSALAVLFALVSGGFAYAFVNRNDAYHKQVTTVNQREATIASNVSQINDLRSKLAAAQAQSQQLQNQIAASAGQVTELQQEKTVLGQCITSINNFFTVVGENGTSAEQSTAQTTMETNCNAAQKYLN